MSAQYANIFKGDCHCGNMRLELHTNQDEAFFIPRECQCTVCTKNGAHWTSDPKGEARLYIKDNDQVSYYRYEGGTSDFTLCKTCGVMMIVLCEIDGTLRSVVNMKSMTDEKFTSEKIQTNFNGETYDSRFGRRGQNWNGNTIVEIESGAVTQYKFKHPESHSLAS